jgi:hypothetical protein
MHTASLADLVPMLTAVAPHVTALAAVQRQAS